MAAKDTLGRQGEQLAAEYLVRQGYRILARNWRCPRGEIDIVAAAAGELVIVEVKSRASLAFGHPFEAITPAKLARLRRLAGAWCEQSGQRGPMRIDAIAVIGVDDPAIEHLQGVF